MGNNRYSAEDRKANQDAHEARMARFTKSEAGTKARQAAMAPRVTVAKGAAPEPTPTGPEAADATETGAETEAQ
jgi:hypothetical protein